MKTELLVFLAFFICIQLFSQKPMRLDVSQSCSFFGETITDDVYGFASDSEAEDALNRVMKYTGLPVNFTIKAGNVPNAAAIIKCNTNTNDCDRFIIYSQDFMIRVKNTAKTDWAAISILAHEIGHHLSGHTLRTGGSRPELELEADRFSGFVLNKMGSTLDQAQMAMKLLAGNKGSSTHPPKSARLAAITNGWVASNEQMKERSGTTRTQTQTQKQTEEADIPPIVTSSISTSSSSVYWRATQEGFWLYLKGEEIKGTESIYAGNDVLAYHAPTNTTYLFRNYKYSMDNTLRSGEIISTSHTTFWRADEEGFRLYDKGGAVTGTQTVYSGDDLIVYDPAKTTTFLLRNYSGSLDDKLRTAEVLSRSAGTLSGGIFWRASETGFYLYEKGQEITGTTSVYAGNDVIAYQPGSNTTYLFRNYAYSKDNKLRSGEALSRISTIFWRATADGFWLYDKGVEITGTTSSYSGNDLIVYASGKNYLLRNYVNNQDNRLRQGERM